MNSSDQSGDSVSSQLEDFLQLIFEGSSDMIFILDENFRYEFISRKETNGYTSEELMGMNPFELVHPDDRNSRELAKIVKNDEGKMELRVRHKNGEWKWVEFRGHSFIANNEKKKFFLIARDIHERKKAEQQLIESEMRYRSLFENSESAITIIDKEGVFLLINKKGAEDLGGEPEDFIGKTLYDIFPKEAAQKNFNINLEVFTTGKPHVYTETYNFPTGKNTYVVNVQPIKDYNEEIIALQIIAIDITEKIGIEQSLKESEEKFKYIVENSNEMIGIFNSKFEYEYMNKALKEISGYTKEDLNKIKPIDLIHPDDLKLATKALRNGILKGGQKEEIRLRDKDGNYFLVDFRAKLYSDVDGKSKVIMILRKLEDR